MKTLLSLFALLLSNVLFAQTDTAITWYNTDWKPVEKKSDAAYYAQVWQEGGKWHRRDYYYPSNKLQMDGFYADKETTIQDGQFSFYNGDGSIEQTTGYINNKKDGPEFLYNPAGKKTGEMLWRQGLTVGTGKLWNEKGALAFLQETDENGDGTGTWYHPDGKKIKAAGPVKAGKKHGHWVMKDEAGVVSMEVDYAADSAIQVVCFDETGALEKKKKDCVPEKPAAFRGGANGWRKHLEKHLQYPNYAQEKNIQGVVKIQFIVEKDGSVSDAKVISAPHETLGREALRMILESPNWEPAVQYNRVVKYRHIQNITFQLK